MSQIFRFYLFLRPPALSFILTKKETTFARERFQRGKRIIHAHKLVKQYKNRREERTANVSWNIISADDRCRFRAARKFTDAVHPLYQPLGSQASVSNIKPSRFPTRKWQKMAVCALHYVNHSYICPCGNICLVLQRDTNGLSELFIFVTLSVMA